MALRFCSCIYMRGVYSGAAISTTTASFCLCNASVANISPEAPSVLENDVECMDDTCSRSNAPWCLDFVRK
jgi:hypothetical protein